MPATTDQVLHCTDAQQLQAQQLTDECCQQ
jgi:hypothetical protein